MQSKSFYHSIGNSDRNTTMALLFAVLFMLTACATTTPPPPAQVESSTAIEKGVAGGVTTNTVEVVAKVTAIDMKNRKATLLLADGTKTTVKVPPEAINFDQVKVGDMLKAVLTEQVVVYIDDAGASVPDGYAAGVALAPKGAQPGGIVAETVQITATVTAIDQTSRKATLRFEDGSVKTFPVRDDIDLSQHAVGEKVVFVVTEIVALSVEKP